MLLSVWCAKVTALKGSRSLAEPIKARKQGEASLMEAVPRKTTIREVAQAASVGVGTISRVINSSSQVGRETRAQVIEAIGRLGFRHDAQDCRILKRRAEIECFLLSKGVVLHRFQVVVV